MSASSTIEISPARLPDDIETVRGLFAEYVDSLGIDLSFQDVGAELAQLPGKYAPPRGAILIARDGAGSALGCVALRPPGRSRACARSSVSMCDPRRADRHWDGDWPRR